MGEEKKGLSIILHSGSYDRIYHGLSIALAAQALGRKVTLFFTYWALGYLRQDKIHFSNWIRKAKPIERS